MNKPRFSGILIFLLAVMFLVSGASAVYTKVNVSYDKYFLCQNSTQNLTFQDVRACVAPNISVGAPSAATGEILRASTTSNKYYTDYQDGETAITHMGQNIIIDSANITLNYFAQYSTLGYVQSSIVDFSPANPLSFVANDRTTTTWTRLTNDVYPGTPAVNASFVFNMLPTQLSKLNQTGYFTFMVSENRTVDDIGYTWASAGFSGHYWRSATFSPLTAPMVQIEWHYGSFAQFTPLGETSGYNNVLVNFNDTSADTPTTWNYSYIGDGAGNNTETIFSTSRNTTASFTPGNYRIYLNCTDALYFNKSTQTTWINVTQPSPPTQLYAYGTSITNATDSSPESDLNPDGSDCFAYQLRNNHAPTWNVSKSVDGGGKSSTWLLGNIGTHYNASMKNFTIEAITNDFSAGISTAQTCQNLKDMRNIVQTNGSTAIILLAPPRSAYDIRDNLTEIRTCLDAANISYVNEYDALDSVRGNNLMDAYTALDIINGIHPNKTGHYLMGEYLWSHYFDTSLSIPISSYTAAPTSGIAPLTVYFTDTSTNNPTSWNWTFNDGSLVNVSQQNPIHTFISPGTYIPNLNATNAYGSNRSASDTTIIVSSPTPTPTPTPTITPTPTPTPGGSHSNFNATTLLVWLIMPLAFLAVVLFVFFIYIKNSEDRPAKQAQEIAVALIVIALIFSIAIGLIVG
jgi:lysophospholipase L1-like esterase